MSSRITPLLERNRAFAATDTRIHAPRLPFLPHRGLYIITCIDPRTDPAQFLGLRFAEAIVARTVGGRVTPAVVQDLSYIGYLVESKAPEGPYFEAAIIHHTDCGSGLLADGELRHGFAQRTGYDEDARKADECTAGARRHPRARDLSQRTRCGAHQLGHRSRLRNPADPLLDRAILDRVSSFYNVDQDRRHPLLSPAVPADLTGLAPLLVQVGTNEMLLDDARRLAARASEAKVNVVLDITAKVPHVFHRRSTRARPSCNGPRRRRSAFCPIRAPHRTSRCPATSTTSTPG